MESLKVDENYKNNKRLNELIQINLYYKSKD